VAGKTQEDIFISEMRASIDNLLQEIENHFINQSSSYKVRYVMKSLQSATRKELACTTMILFKPLI
jgi:hypothetical protein